MAKKYYMTTPDYHTYYSENHIDFKEDIIAFYKENNEPINLYELEDILGKIQRLPIIGIYDCVKAGFSVEINNKTLDFTVREDQK